MLFLLFMWCTVIIQENGGIVNRFRYFFLCAVSKKKMANEFVQANDLFAFGLHSEQRNVALVFSKVSSQKHPYSEHFFDVGAVVVLLFVAEAAVDLKTFGLALGDLLFQKL